MPPRIRLRPSSVLNGLTPRITVAPRRIIGPNNVLAASRPTTIESARTLLTISTLPNQDLLEENGLGDLYSPSAFNLAWKSYQSHILERLNMLTAGTPLENKHALEIAILTARNSDQAAIFNYASMAHNNQFYFESLTTAKTSPSQELSQMITRDFGTEEFMKQSFIATGLACFGNAFVWVVLGEGRKLKILTTYNAGTYSGEAWRRQSVDMNTTTPSSLDPKVVAGYPATDYLGGGASESAFLGALRGLTDRELSKNREEENVRIEPLFCVNVWQHAWIPDYGFDKKEQFLENFWNCVDWDVVYNRYVAWSGKAQPRTLAQPIRAPSTTPAPIVGAGLGGSMHGWN